MEYGLISIDKDVYGRSKEFTAFVCDPGRRPLAQINGIAKFDIAYKFNDLSTISFEVPRYVENASTHVIEENLAYMYLHSFCEIYIPELRSRAYFIINEEPHVIAESTANERKEFTAYSYESVLMYENLVLFDINQGTETSREIWESGGSTINPVRLYFPQNENISLLHLVLKDDYYGWDIGHVDGTIAGLQRAFSIDNQNVYSFLRQDMCKAFRCIVEFDTVNKLINVYDIETVGSQSNIYLGFENFIKQINIAPATSEIYTVFNVAGDGDLGIERINFGSNKIYDITYPLSLCNPDLATKWSQYEDERENFRSAYSELAAQYAGLQIKYNSIMDRQPDDVVNTNWASPLITLEELQTELNYARWYVAEIENEYTTEEDVVDWDELQVSADAATYYSFLYIVIPDLQAEIAARNAGNPYTAEKVKQEYVWEVYGLNDLINEQSKLRESIQLYIDGGFSDPTWSPSKHIDQGSYNAQHQAYLNLLTKQSSLATVIQDRFEKKEALEDQMNALNTQMVAVANQASFDSYIGAGRLFSLTEGATIKSLFRESDYQDSNYLITDYDDELSIVATQHDLYEAAEKRLAVESRPQLTWSVDVADLFNIEEFKPLKDNLQIGDFIILGFATEDVIPINATTFRTTSDGIVVMVEEGNEVRLTSKSYIKLRCVEFDFSGLKTNTNFTIVFSTMTSSKYQNDDFESLLGDYLTSKTNAISVRAANAASTTANKIATSLIRPYIQILKAQIDEANIQSANIEELKGVWGHFETLLVDYLTAAQAQIQYAQIDLANVGMIASRDLDAEGNPTSWWNLDTGELSLAGYLIRAVTEYAVGTSPTIAPAASQFHEADPVPTPGTGEYVWQRIVLIDGGGDRHPSTPVCINGVPGEKGDDGIPAVSVNALSSRGLVFRNENEATNIDVVVRYGAETITSIAALRAAFGQSAKIVWKIRQMADSNYTTIADNDSRISNDGFRFTMSPSDIVKQTTIIYEVWG